MNDAVLLIAIMLGIVVGLGWLCLVMTVVADLVRDWRGDAVRREMLQEMGEIMRQSCAACQRGFAQRCERCRSRLLSDDDGPAAVAEADRLVRERRGTG